MTLVRVNKDNLDEYEEFIKKHPKGLFQHSSKWAKVKSAWKFEAIMTTVKLKARLLFSFVQYL